MDAQAQYRERDDSPTEDHTVCLHDVSWENYERLLEMRGDHSAPRISYLEGEVEIMSPSRTHEAIKSLIGRLLETYCMEREIPFSVLGPWTLKSADRTRGAEPDECYIFGDPTAERPHLAIEVIWTSGRIDTLDIYRRLGVAEVWYWRKGVIEPYGLRGDRYVPVAASEVLPELDLGLLTQFLDCATTSAAIKGYREALQRSSGQN